MADRELPVFLSRPPARCTALALAVATLALAGCSQGEQTAVGHLEIDVREVLLLGGNDSGPLEELFSDPQSVDTDKDGRIYVADQRENLLKVFNPDGTLAWTAGSTGQGPGEYQRLSRVVVTDSRVLVRDDRSRAINWYEHDGSLGGHFVPEPTKVRLGEALRPLKGSRFVTAYAWLPEREKLLSEPLLAVIDSAFGTVTSRFGSLAELGVDPGEWWRLLTVRPGTVAVGIDGQTVYFVPQTYDGRIFRFSRSGEQWASAEPITGYAPLPHPATVTEEVTVHQNVTKMYMAGQPGPLTFAVHHASHALYELSDGRLVHFSLLEQEGRLLQYVELFDRSGRLLAHGPLPVYPDGSTLERVWDRLLMHKDDKDRFYFRDRRGGLPTVSVVHLEFNIR